MILTYEGQAENINTDDVVKELLSKVPVIWDFFLFIEHKKHKYL
jgi:hypothetical protein